MTLARAEKEIKKSEKKGVTPERRGELVEVLMGLSDEINRLFELLNEIKDIEPEEVIDPKVEKLGGMKVGSK